MSWSVSAERPLREQVLSTPERLPANPVPAPDMTRTKEHKLVFEGGAMGGMRKAMMGGRMVGMRELADAGRFWAINGEVPTDLQSALPLLSFEQGMTQIVTLENRTAWLHPVHLHGHSFHVLGSAEDAAPGKWMLHCHVLEHQASGMMGIVEVA
jgi:FtsP/CotA-like multicopper oxidase with cupredoxin domain